MDLPVPGIFAFEFSTLDGLSEGAEPRSLGWPNGDAEFNDFAVAPLESADPLRFGRRTYEGMARYWPTEARVPAIPWSPAG